MQICESRLEKVIGSGCEEYVADEVRLCQYIYTVGNVAHIIAGQLKHSTLLLIQNLLIDDSLFKEAEDDGIFNKLIIIVKPTYKKYLKLVIKHFFNPKSLCQLLFYFYSYRTDKIVVLVFNVKIQSACKITGYSKTIRGKLNQHFCYKSSHRCFAKKKLRSCRLVI